jgi:hypothetical protein
MKPSRCLCLLFLASILAAASAVVTVSPKEMTTAAGEMKAAWAPAAAKPDEAFLARLCDEQRRGRRVLPWCKQLHANRHHRYLPTTMPPPSRDGEEIDPRYGVSKRLVPSGPNKLHN